MQSAMVLCGPEHFFKHGKSILPWCDDPDSPQAAKHVKKTPEFRKIPPVTRSPSDATHDMEFSPSSPLPCGWECEPKSVGISIRVLPPSTTAGKLLLHCKDRFFTLLENILKYFVLFGIW